MDRATTVIGDTSFHTVVYIYRIRNKRRKIVRKQPKYMSSMIHFPLTRPNLTLFFYSYMTTEAIPLLERVFELGDGFIMVKTHSMLELPSRVGDLELVLYSIRQCCSVILVQNIIKGWTKSRTGS